MEDNISSTNLDGKKKKYFFWGHIIGMKLSQFPLFFLLLFFLTGQIHYYYLFLFFFSSKGVFILVFCCFGPYFSIVASCTCVQDRKLGKPLFLTNVDTDIPCLFQAPEISHSSFYAPWPLNEKKDVAVSK